MLLAVYISEKEGFLSKIEAEQVNTIILSTGLIADLELDQDRILKALQSDKKRKGDSIQFILINGIGKAIDWQTNFSKLEEYFIEWVDTISLK